MREMLQAMSPRSIAELVALILVAAALIYGVSRWSLSHRKAVAMGAAPGGDETRQTTEATYEQTPIRPAFASEPDHAKRLASSPPRDSSPRDSSPTDASPRDLGKLRSGREQDRQSEDDIVRKRMGPRGVPGQPAPANSLPENETQISKSLDPGHTA